MSQIDTFMNWTIKIIENDMVIDVPPELKKQLVIERTIKKQAFKHSDLIITGDFLQSAEHILKFQKEFEDSTVEDAKKEFIQALDKLLWVYKDNILDDVKINDDGNYGRSEL